MSSSPSKEGGGSFPTLEALSVGEDDVVGMGGSEGSLPAEERGELFDTGKSSELILRRIWIGFGKGSS